MKGYGNMSAAEKALNRDDLHAYKAGDNKNYVMIPGIQQNNIMNTDRIGASPSRTNAQTSFSATGSPKRQKESTEKLKENYERFKAHGAVHLGSGVSLLEPKHFLGHGNLLNGGMPNQKSPTSFQKETRADAIYSGPAGSHLGVGKFLNDGTIDRQVSPQIQTSLDNKGNLNSLLPSPYVGSPLTSRIEKLPGLKAQSHAANGGIGVSYSNVMLGGASNYLMDNPPVFDGRTTNQVHFARDRKQTVQHDPLNPDLLNNQRHTRRFVNNNQVTVTGAASSSDNISYVKGIDFNS